MKKVVVGMSGGVDSSVVVFLLKEAGYKVIGLFMRNWDSILNNDILGNKNQGNICPEEQDWNDAKNVAKTLEIEIHRVDFVKEYWDSVFQTFIYEYKNGRTPNPDIMCNKFIKFDLFTKYAFEKFDADFVATGHYAIVDNNELFKGHDRNKDQSYFLSQLSSNQLKNIIFPLGKMQKQDVRKIALEQKLSNANKKDSTGICFIGERNFAKFLENYIPNKPGNIVDITNGKIIGKHNGVMYYTIGQRKGIHLGGMPEPYYVAKNDVNKKILYVAPQSQPEYLISYECILKDVNLNTSNFNKDNLSAKFRYRQDDIKVVADFDIKNKTAIVKYENLEAITPGQHCVFYDGNKCIGGGIIDIVKTLK